MSSSFYTKKKKHIIDIYFEESYFNCIMKRKDHRFRHVIIPIFISISRGAICYDTKGKKHSIYINIEKIYINLNMERKDYRCCHVIISRRRSIAFRPFWRRAISNQQWGEMIIDVVILSFQEGEA